MIRRDKHLAIAVFLGPAMVLYAGFFALPMAQAFYVALFRWRGVSLDRQFVGFENFCKLLTNDPVFWQCLMHNLAFLVVSLVVTIPLALFFASVLSGRLHGSQTYRAVFLFPNVISIVAVAALWSFVYHPTFGILNSFLKSIGLERYTTGWLGEPKTALPCVIATSIWYSLGFYIVLLLAGVQSIPRSFYEAAWIDGAGGWQSFRYVTIPLVWEILKLAIVYLIIHTINIFGLVWVMTEGGPNFHTETLLTYLYRQAFVQSNFGYATALGVVVFVIIFGITVIANRLMKRETVEY
ncbi:MAG: sugar ABC transporter permease [Armatimonadetes bacterium]|nr:sugar ABC transporter permease [Armatimonadota bacterium]